MMEEKLTTSRKKRPRRGDSSDSEENEKKRGRPRLEKNDESAADRRRTQIRLAQRAYRQRKESTLDELRKRVSDLSTTIELMNKTFLECRDHMSAFALVPEQVQDLHDMSVQFSRFVKDARNPQDEALSSAPANTVQHAETQPRSGSHEVEVESNGIAEVRSVASWLDQSAVMEATKPKASREMDVGMGYEISYPEEENYLQPAEYPFRYPTSKEMMPFQTDELNTASGSLAPASDALMAGATLPIPELPLPRSFSYQETSLGRRLFRGTIEAGYYLLLEPQRRPKDFERVFRLTMMGIDRMKLLAHLKMKLSQGPHEELDFWQAPLIHVGGAGTHYPRRDAFGNLMPKKSSSHIGLIGPQTLALLENASRDNISADMTVEVAGYEGEWYDPYDVQGYLEEKGIFIDPSSSFVEAEIEDHSPDASSISTLSSPRSLLTPTEGLAAAPSSIAQTDGSGLAGADFREWGDLANGEPGAIGFSDAQGGSWMNFLQPGEGIKAFNANSTLAQPDIWNGFPSDALLAANADVLSNHAQSPPRRPTKKVIIDVSRFVKSLIGSAVCLGRAPGYRKASVDNALARASIESF